MDVAFLGTGSGYPTPCRGASAIAMRYEGDVWLVDCGEGTQTQLMKLKLVKPGAISKVFITHLHGDHMFGLPGILCTISMAFKPNDIDNIVEKSAKRLHHIVEIYGPIGLRRFLRETLSLSRSALSFKYVVHELVPLKDQYTGNKFDDLDWTVWNPDHLAKGSLHPSELDTGRAIFHDAATNQWPVCTTSDFVVVAGQLKHRVPSFGYVFAEKSKPGKLDSDKLMQYGVPKGPLYGKIKKGEKVILEDGRTVDPSDFIGPPQQGRKVAILQDSCDSWSMKAACENCDVLIHEATNENSHQERCVENGHSTPCMAGQFASACSADTLVLTHCSQRYKHRATHDVTSDDVTSDILVSEAQEHFSGPVISAYDGLLINVKRKRS